MIVKYQSNNSFNGGTHTITISEPDECPICKNYIKPVYLYGFIYEDVLKNWYCAVVFKCQKCQNIFISKYKCIDTSSYNFSLLEYTSPNKFVEESFDERISNLSPSFVKIYNQSLEAEHHKLDQIAGLGYRRALEFLIKDYLISKFPDKEVSIKNDALGNCINTFIDNPQLKTTASRAVWLGNDFAHYLRKYDDKDITDLKRLINLSVNWLMMIYLTEETETIEKR